jgi:hypothetical protein
VVVEGMLFKKEIYSNTFQLDGSASEVKNQVENILTMLEKLPATKVKVRLEIKALK